MNDNLSALLVALLISSAVVFGSLLIKAPSISTQDKYTMTATNTQAATAQITNDQNAHVGLIAPTRDERSQAWWSKFYLGATLIGLMATAGALGASYRTLVYSDRISSSQKIQIANALKSAAQANQRAEAARAQIASAEAAAAGATAQAERARADAADATARAAKVEEAARWRSVPKDSRAKLISELATGPGGNVVLAYAGNDPEAVFLASRYDLIFREANQRVGKTIWNVEIQPRVYSHGVFFGLRVLGPVGAATDFMRSAFTAAGIDFSAEAIPPVLNDSPGMTISIGPPVVPLIFIGPKWQPH